MKEVAQARPTEDLKLKVIAKATPTPTDDEETYSGPVARLPPSPLSILSIVFAFFKMSDHLHVSSVQGSNREQKDAYRWREENRILRKDKDRKWDKIKEMFGKMVLNQNKDKRFEEERPIHRRKIYNSHYQRKEGVCFEPRSLYYST